jgi:hypothetical protein
MDVQKLIDKQAIKDLQVRYAMAIDHGRYDELDEVLLPDAVADYGATAGHQQGLEAIKDTCRVALEPLTAVQHLNGNHWAEIDGDTATAGCYLTVHQHMVDTPGGDHFDIGARYDDELIRTEAGWRMTKRTLTTLWTEGNPAVRYNR